MNYRDKPQLQDRLAAEYVLGTLRGRARQRFRSWMRGDDALARRVRDWESRLMPLAEAVEPVEPPRRVWKAIEAQVTASAAAPERRAGIWESLAFWRNWGLVTTGLAAALVAAMALQKPEVVEVVRTVEVRRNGMEPSFVAMLNDESGRMRIIAYAPRMSNELWVKVEGMDPARPGVAYQLWGLPTKPGQAPMHLGTLPSTPQGMVKLAAVADEVLSDYPKLAITMEPEGGSPVPTGPMVAKGDCVKTF